MMILEAGGQKYDPLTVCSATATRRHVTEVTCYYGAPAVVLGLQGRAVFSESPCGGADVRGASDGLWAQGSLLTEVTHLTGLWGAGCRQSWGEVRRMTGRGGVHLPR